MQKQPPKVLCKKGVLRNFAKFTGPSTLLKKRLWHRCFPVSFTKFLRNLFYRTPLGHCFCKWIVNFVIVKTQSIVAFRVETVSAMLVKYLLTNCKKGYDEQKYQVGKCTNGTCEQLKDKIKEKNVITESIKRKGNTFGSFLGHGMFGF